MDLGEKYRRVLPAAHYSGFRISTIMCHLRERKENQVMKSTVFLLMLALSIVGCDLGQNSSSSVEPLVATVHLADTSGREKTIFHPSENFDISFELTNGTDRRLSFGRASSTPDVGFRVTKGDSLAASSTDGYVFLMVATVGYLDPDQTMQGYWRGPTTPAQDPKVRLSIGSYTLQVLFPHFDRAVVKEVPAIQFSVVE
jgi:hypothetical protein